jgi:hypothetical protein
MLVLMVPKPNGRCVAVGNVPLDADGSGFEQRGEKLAGQLLGKIGESMGRIFWIFFFLFQAFT